MAEDVARAVGAGDPEPIKIGGKDVYLKPLTLVELTEIERECLRQYRRDYVETFAGMADLLGDEGQNLIMRKVEEAAKFDLSTLPKKDAYDQRRVHLTPELESWVRETYSDFEDVLKGKQQTEVERRYRIVVASALDSGDLTNLQYESLSGGMKIVPHKIAYVHWWITGTMQGMLAMVGQAFKKEGVSKEEVFDAVAKKPALLIQIARDLETLSSPQAGNG